MRKIKKLQRWYVITSCLFLGVTLLLSSMVGVADLAATLPANTQQMNIDCRLSPNPDECYQQQTSGQRTGSDLVSLLRSGILSKLNSHALGLDSPLSFDLKYDTRFAWIFGLNYFYLLSDSLGVATKLTGGPNELRANMTAAYALDTSQQLKWTYEYLTQRLPFDFQSGTVNQWVSEYSLGLDYQYLLKHEIVHSLEISGYITRARSKDLSAVAFDQQQISANEYSYSENYRRIAGGRENTFLASLNLFPFKDKLTSLVVGAGYSEISYDMRYEDSFGTSNKTAAYKIEFTHLFSLKDKLAASINSTAASRESQLKYSRLLPRHLEGTLTAQYTGGHAGMPDNHALVAAFTFPAAEHYSLGGFSDLEDFKSWLQKPVVYEDRVLAIKDERVQQYSFKTLGNPSDQTKYFYQLLDEVNTSNYFSFNDPALTANFSVFIQRLTVGAQAASSTRDYTHELNVAIVKTGANQASLQSATNAGFPATDSSGETTVGTYLVTITGVGTAAGSSSPMTIATNFQLTVTGSGSGGTALWIPPTTASPPHFVSQETYDYDLNTGTTVNGSLTSSLIDTRSSYNGPRIPDHYRFILSNPIPTGWSITSNNHLYAASPTGATVTLFMMANSNATGGGVGEGTERNGVQKYVLQAGSPDTPPVWNIKDSSITFTQTGDGGADLGLPDAGINLSAMVGSNALDIRFASNQKNNTKSLDKIGNWQISNVSGTFYLNRIKNAFGQLDAQDVGSILTFPGTDSAGILPALKVCELDAHGNLTANCATTTSSAPLKVTLNPDPSLLYEVRGYLDASKVITLTAATSNGTNGRANVVQPILTLLFNPLGANTFNVYTNSGSLAAKIKGTQISNDSLYGYEQPSSSLNSRAYINYSGSSTAVTGISFNTPNTNEYVRLLAPDQHYLFMNSKASGLLSDDVRSQATSNILVSAPGLANPYGLPGITVDKLILVPSKILNNMTGSEDQTNMSNNMSLGFNFADQVVGTQRGTALAMAFYLPSLPSPKLYQLTASHLFYGAPATTLTDPLAGLCNGYARAKQSTSHGIQYNVDSSLNDGGNEYGLYSSSYTGPNSRCIGPGRIGPTATNAPLIVPSLDSGKVYTLYVSASGLNYPAYATLLPTVYGGDTIMPSMGRFDFIGSDYSQLPYVEATS